MVLGSLWMSMSVIMLLFAVPGIFSESVNQVVWSY